MISQTSTYPHLNETLQGLICNLMADPFSVSNGFGELTLEEIGFILEEPLSESSPLKETFDGCKSTYCLILIELELMGLSSIPNDLLEKPIKDFVVNHASPDTAHSKVTQIFSEHQPEIEREEVTNLNPRLELSSSKDFNSITVLEKEYSELAFIFTQKSFPNNFSISKEAAQRTAIQFSIASCEISLFTGIRDSLKNFWPSRIDDIHKVLAEKEFKFNQSWIEKIANDEKSYSLFLFEETFPRLASLHCLKYLTLSKNLETLHPSTFELATLIYFWGPKIKFFNPNSGENDQLELQDEQTVPLAFRLYRLDRIKAISTNFNRPLTQSLYETGIADCSFIKDWLGDLHINSADKKVA